MKLITFVPMEKSGYSEAGSDHGLLYLFLVHVFHDAAGVNCQDFHKLLYIQSLGSRQH